jgi:hypothetical protein
MAAGSRAPRPTPAVSKMTSRVDKRDAEQIIAAISC